MGRSDKDRMQYLSLRTFVGAKDYDLSRQFYRELGFVESVISDNMCYYAKSGMGFYLQRYYVKKWVDNTMLFMEVDDVDACLTWLKSLDLPSKFKGVRLSEIKDDWWGRECFLHDPSGVLWHFGQFKKNPK